MDSSFLWRYAIKDLFRQKTRSLMGIFGVAISLFLLTSVSFITDTVSYNFINFLTVNSGNQDIVLETRDYYGQPANRTSYFNYKEIQEEIRANVSEVGNFFPRFEIWSLTNGSIENPINTFDKEIQAQWVSICALDFDLEESKNFGRYTDLNPDFNVDSGIMTNSCMVSKEFAQDFGVKAGETLKLFVYHINNTINLTISTTFNQNLKFPLNEERDIIVDINWWGNLLDQMENRSDPYVNTWKGKTNKLIIQITDSENIYDTRDIEKSEEIIMDIGANIIMTIGIDAWELDYPKLDDLFVSEILSISMNILFMMIGIISMLISGILINSILSTSVEEKIREYGINRVLGARKSYNLKLIIIQSLILCTTGTTLGILSAYFITSYIVMPLIGNLIIKQGLPTILTFVIQPQSIILSYAIGIGVSLIVSINPALKVMRMKIVDSINPYRSTDELYTLKKEGGAKMNLVVIGLILALNGGFVYFLIPRVLLSLKFGLLAQILIGSLMLFLIGGSLMAVGFIPVLIRFFLKIFEPFNQKLMTIIKTTVFRHHRRNLSTIIMFVLSFSFIMYTTAMIEIQTEQIGALIQYENGSDLVIYPKYYNLKAPTAELQSDLMKIDGIERTSKILALNYNLDDIYSEGSEKKEFNVNLGDYVNFKSGAIRLYGIDENYKETVWNPSFIRFTEGEKNQAFTSVFNNSEINIIISTHVASGFKIHLGQTARLTFTRGTETIPYVVKVVGVAKNMPGMNRFREGALTGSAVGGGVIISESNYIKCMNIPGGKDAFLNKIFVKVKEDYNHTIVAQEIETKFEKEYNIDVRITNEGIQEAERSFLIVKYLFLGILLGTVIIALFGLISSSYSSILERKREIGIIRTLGLYGDEVRKLFLLENLILLLSSSTSGSLIGFLMAIGLSENLTLFTDSPRIIAIPWNIVAIIYAISILSLILGMRWLMRRLKKKSLIDIFRETL